MKLNITDLSVEDAEVIEALIGSQIILGIDSIKGRSLRCIASAIRSSVLRMTTGVWEHREGEFTFSFFYWNNRVAAIKLLREATGLGLKESKDIIDNCKPVGDGSHQLLITNSTEKFFDDLCYRVRGCTDSTLGGNRMEVRASVKKVL